MVKVNRHPRYAFLLFLLSALSASANDSNNLLDLWVNTFIGRLETCGSKCDVEENGVTYHPRFSFDFDYASRTLLLGVGLPRTRLKNKIEIQYFTGLPANSLRGLGSLWVFNSSQQKFMVNGQMVAAPRDLNVRVCDVGLQMNKEKMNDGRFCFEYRLFKGRVDFQNIKKLKQEAEKIPPNDMDGRDTTQDTRR
jgi:hypothetical protein